MVKIKQRVQFFILLALGCVLIYFSIVKLNIQELLRYIKEANFWIAIPVYVISVFGYYVRSLRWKLILGSMNLKVSVISLFSCLGIGYAVNIVTPRLGEVARCLMLKKVDNVSIEQSGISVILERVIDIITLAIIVLCAAIIEINQSSVFIYNQIWLPILASISTIPIVYLVTLLVIFIGVLYLFTLKVFKPFRQSKFATRAIQSFKDFMHLKQKWRFVVYTMIIWVCYFLMTYLWFFLFSETQKLGLYEAFVIMAVGSIGRSVPIQGGGMGAYHYLVSNAFALFGITLVLGNAMAFIIHGAQIILTFVLGLFCWIWILYNVKINDEK